MGRIGPKDSKPEMVVRRMLHRVGYRFRLHRRDLPGTPDIVLPARRKAIFVHGCWWHRHDGCSKAKPPRSNAEFWNAKFDRNVERDRRALASLEEAGWDALTIWECEIRDASALESTLIEFVERRLKPETAPFKAAPGRTTARSARSKPD